VIFLVHFLDVVLFFFPLFFPSDAGVLFFEGAANGEQTSFFFLVPDEFF